jgi:NAD(P)-dependent dehydrogenase (short-subunit alcohol dehydrogenase family)
MGDRLKNRIAFITGACSGIGLATARLFVAEGARVLAADIQDDRGAELEGRFAGSLKYCRCDVLQPEQIQRAIDLAAAHFGGLDIVFNNAGAAGERGGIEELTLEGWDRTHALLLRSVVAGTKFALPHLKARGGGSIVNTSSVSALASGYAPIAYSAAKAAVLHFSKLAAADLAKHKVRVNAVLPGFIATPIFGHHRGLDRGGAERLAATLAAKAGGMQPAGRTGMPEDIAQAVLYFASDAAGFVTGTHLVVDGGLTIGTRASWDPRTPSAMRQVLDSIPPPG